MTPPLDSLLASEDELYEQAAAALEDASDGEAEDYDQSILQTLLRINAQLRAENQNESLRQLHDASYLTTAGGDELTTIASDRYSVNRKEAVSATGVVRFSRGSDPTADYSIDNGTPLTTANGSVDFETTEDASIQSLTQFEGGALDSAWSGDDGLFSTQSSTVYDGSQSLSVPAQSGVGIWRDDLTVEVGDRLVTYCYLPTNGKIGIRFGVEDGDTYNAFVVDEGTDTVELHEVIDGADNTVSTESVTIPDGEWIRLVVDQSTQGEVDGIVQQPNKTAIGRVETDTITLRDGGIGIESRDGSTVKYADVMVTTATACNVVCQTEGAIGNVSQSTVEVMQTQPTGIDAVTNPYPIGDPTVLLTDESNSQRGVDRETDAELRERALDATSFGGSASGGAIETALSNIEDVISVSAKSNSESTDNSGSGGLPPYSTEVIVYGGATAEIVERLADLMTVVDFKRLTGGVNGTKETYDVYSSLLDETLTGEITRPTKVDVDIDVDVVVTDAYAGDSAVKDTIASYIGGFDTDNTRITALGIGEDVLVGELIERVGRIDGVRGVSSTTLDRDGDGTDDMTTNSNGLDVLAIDNTEVAITNAADDSITISTTEV